jgi:ATP-dependent Lon protease
VRLEEKPVADDVEAEALAMSLRDVAKQVIQLMPELPREAQSLIDSIQEPGSLADLVAANLDAPVEEKVQLMSTIDVKDRIRQVLKLLTRQLEILKMRERINSQIKEEMGKNQREYVLRQQLKAIKEELGEDEGDQGDLDGLEERIAKANLPNEAEQRGAQAAPAAAVDAGGQRGVHRGAHVPRLAPRPAVDGADPRQPRDRQGARGARRGPLRPREGEEAHPRVPRGAQAQETDKKGPILCLLGPPGVGKTSLGRSIAGPSGASSCASPSAACTTRRPSAGTGAPTWARCPDRSSRA